MKVVLLTPGTGSYYCGVCMRDNALARELIRQGHDAVVVPMYLPLSLDEAPAKGTEHVFFGGINVYLQQKFSFFRESPRWLDRLLDSRGLLRLAASRSDMTDGAELGALTLSMLEGEHGHQAKEVRQLVEWLVSGERPDAIWISTALLAGLARPIRDALKIPVICSLQGEDVFLDDLPEPWRARSWELLAACGKEIAAFVAPSRYYAELMGRRLGIAPPQLHVIPNGITLDGFEPAVAPESPPVIGFLARFILSKGLDLVAEAFLTLRKRGRFPAVRLRCIGAMTSADRALVRTLQKKFAAAGLHEAVEFHPNVSREKKIELLRTLSLLSVPARYGEAFGLYLIEALAAGVPLVQPRSGAFPEILEETGGGILFEEFTPDSLADAWETLLADPTRARDLGRRGRESVLARYSIERLARDYLAVTEQTTQSVSPAPR